jgi:hypothetical protein
MYRLWKFGKFLTAHHNLISLFVTFNHGLEIIGIAMHAIGSTGPQLYSSSSEASSGFASLGQVMIKPEKIDEEDAEEASPIGIHDF